MRKEMNIFQNIKKELRDGLVKYMEKKDPGKSLSTYKTYVSDSNYLINNGFEDEYLRFVRSNEAMPEIQQIIKNSLIAHRGIEKVKDGGSYYYEKLCWQREYIHSIGGIDIFLISKEDNDEEQREWILPCNTQYYDVHKALRELKIIDWRQTVQLNKAQVGDIVYIYCTDKKNGFVKYKGAILAVNKMVNIIDDSKYTSDGTTFTGPCIEIAVFRDYDLGDELTYAKLKEHGLLSTLQGPTVIKGSVSDYLHECDKKQREFDRFSGDIPDTCLVPFPISVNENLNNSRVVVTALDDSHSEEEKEIHAKSLSLDELKMIAKGQQTKKPKQVMSTVTRISRDPYISEYAKKRANGICQLCGNKAPFCKADGEPYLESHHIEWLSKGGADSIGNTVALCPNCHKKMHIVNDEKDIQKLIRENMNSLDL